jgi:hypothetical protein
VQQQDTNPARLEFQGEPVHGGVERRLAGAVRVVSLRIYTGDAAHVGA